MIEELSRILDDIKNRKYIESYIVLIIGIIVSIVSIFSDDIGQKWVEQTILAILSALIYLIVLERRENSALLRQNNNQIEGIDTYSTSRASLPSFSKVDLPNAKHEVIVQGVGQNYIVHECLGLLATKAREGCQIKILMMAPRDSEGNANPFVADYESHWEYSGLQSQLDSHLERFKEWLNSIDNFTRSQIEIRQYLTYPVGNFLFVDKDNINGYVRVETPHLYRIHVHDLPYYRVTKSKNPEFFQVHVEAFNRFWDISTPINC